MTDNTGVLTDFHYFAELIFLLSIHIYKFLVLILFIEINLL